MMKNGRNVARAVALAWLGGTGAVGVGCTLLNSYDALEPVKPGPDGSPSSSGSGSDSGSSSGSGSDSGSSSGTTADAGDAEAVQNQAAHGAIVVGGEVQMDGGRQLVLSAIDPSTGSELPKARKPLNVAGVAYDGVRDLWYVFESGGAGIFPLPTDPFYLHTMTLDAITGEWTELGKFQIPTGVSFTTTTVIKQRVSYIAYGDGTLEGGVPEEGGAPYSLVTLDTSDPANVTVLPGPIGVTGTYSALVGVPSGVSTAGGFEALGSTARVDGGVISQLTPIVVPGTGSISINPPILGIAPVGGLVGVGTATIMGTTEALVITHPQTAGGPATLAIYDPSQSDPTMALVGAGTFPFSDGNPRAPAFSICQQVAFVIGTNGDLALHAVSIAGAMGSLPSAGPLPMLSSAATPTGHSGQTIYFEPYTNTVLTPFSQGDNFALTAFTLGGSMTAPTLTERQAPTWVPPPDLRPNFVATKVPSTFDCNMLMSTVVGGDH
jgi:hypothetical protein